MKAIRTVLTVLALTVGTTLSARAQAARTPPPRMPHPAAGKLDCLSCHAPNANAHITSTPAAHHFANNACAMCHRPMDKTPPNAAHAFDAAHTACVTCHAPNSTTLAKAPPDWHAHYDVAICALCHQPGQGS
ncbi:MAG: hypothetical protein ACHQU1_06460 [Gemmatimonadales bacterium]